MRIQHNILAMNAYRNYNTNTSALSKNLEKLSSGYKINRAGDDAAGLAISEKMRAQITGLNAAQKNVKDGISLVKTAEGAMQEIQDMLNRMDYLATQSANGTYDNEVDRKNLQKEVDALKTEIDRIADSANFNGIKLLDGSLDSTIEAKDAVTETVTVNPTESEALTFENGKLAEVGQILGSNTVLHNEANGDHGTVFSLDLHNFKFNASEGNSLTIKMGDTEIKLTADEDAGDLEGADLVNAFLGGSDKSFTLTVDGKTVDSLDGMQINGQTMTVEQGDLDYRLTFTQQKAPGSEAEEINGAMNVTISGEVKPKNAEYSFDVANFKDTAGTAISPAEGDVLTINGKQYVVTADDIGANDAASWESIIKNANTAGIDGYKVTIKDGKVTMKANDAGEKTTPTIAYKHAAASANTTATGTVTGATGAAATKDAAAKVTANTGTLAIAGETVVEAGDFTGTAINGTTADGKYNWSIAANGTATITAAENGTKYNGNITVAVDGTDETVALAGGVDEKAESATWDVTGWKDSNLGTFDGALGDGTAFSLDYTQLAAAGDRGVTVTDANGNDLGYTAVLDGNELTITAKVPGTADGTVTGAPASTLNNTATFNVYDAPVKLSEDGGTITVEQKGASGGAMSGITEGAHGDFNVSTTTIQNVTAGGGERLASTFFDLTEDMVKDGAQITIGEETYTFTTNEKLVGTGKYVDARGDLLSIAKNLTDAAKGNAVWTVGHDGSRITLTETVAHGALDTHDTLQDYKNDANTKFDLSTKEGIEQSLGFVGAGSYTKENVISEATEGGKPLTLQIGDTADKFNQLTVSIGDMHVSAMGTEDGAKISDIDISTLEGAQNAVQTIKDAINYVSGVRGDLGATQNRLEHTANNLSVMAENIQDAESTIRDTDIAEEMMSYTKNNILIQSAQAMLAQANAVPQGVLQLLG